MNRWIILDRDGVINQDSPDYIKSPEEWHPLPGSVEAIAQLSQSGYQVLVATNQSGIGRGFYSENTLKKIHQKMEQQIQAAGGKIKGIFFCPHLPTDHCTCRKPLPGLFQQIATQFKLDLTDIPAVGDSLRDLQAAQTAGCKPILVLTGNGQKTQENLTRELQNIPIYPDLAAATDALLENI